MSLESRLPLFWVQRNEDWSVEGAYVRVSLVCFAHPNEACATESVLDGEVVGRIYPNLRAVDDSGVKRLAENQGLAFQGIKEVAGRRKDGPGFKLTGSQARLMLRAIANPNERPNSDVIRPYWDGEDLTERPKDGGSSILAQRWKRPRRSSTRNHSLMWNETFTTFEKKIDARYTGIAHGASAKPDQACAKPLQGLSRCIVSIGDFQTARIWLDGHANTR